MKDLKTRFDVLATAAEKVVEHFKSTDSELDRFARELHEASAAAVRAFREAGEAMAMPGPARPAMAATGGAASMSVSADSSGLQGLAESMASLPAIAAASAAQIGPALTAAMRPMMSIGTTLTTQFNQVAGTFTTLARRIDASMKFPQFEAFLRDLEQKAPEAWQKQLLAATRTAAKIHSVWSSLGDVAARPLAKIARTSFAPVSSSATRLSISIKGIGGAARQATSGMNAFGRSALAAMGVFGGAFAAVSFLKTGIKSASDLNETINKFESILGDAAPAARSFADKLSADFGLVKQNVLDAEAAFGGLGKGLGGLSGDKLSAFSNQFTQLAADLSSFANLDMGEAVKALQTGLAGNQSDTLKNMGVILTDEAVRARAVAAGFAATTDSVSESAKVQARALMIAEQLSDANGDLAKTASSPANMYRRLMGTINNLATSVGQSLMPIMTKIGNAMTSGLQAAQGLWNRNKQAVLGLQTAAFTAFESIKIGLTDAWTALQTLPAVIDEAFGAKGSGMVAAFGQSIVDNISQAVSGAGSFLRNMGEYFDIAALQGVKSFMTLQDVAAQVADWFQAEWVHIMLDGLQVVVRGILDLNTMFSRFAMAVAKWGASGFKDWKFDPTPMTRGFKSATAQLPELIRPDLSLLDEEINKHWSNIGANDEKFRKRIGAEVEAANAAPAPGKPKPGPAGEQAEAQEPEKKERGGMQTAGALELGSKEAASALAKFNNGGLESAAKRQLDESRKQTQLLTQLAQKKSDQAGVALSAMGIDRG